MPLIKIEDIKSRLVKIRCKDVLLDSDVAELYGVQTKEVNQAVKNNPDKFPDGYVFRLDVEEFRDLRSKILTTNRESADAVNKVMKSRVLPFAFSERGLYMLSTILKSKQATQTAIAIIETFAQIRELAHTVEAIKNTDNADEQKTLLEKTSSIVSSVLGEELGTTNTETEIELNLAVVKIKHTIKRGKNNNENNK